MNCGSPFFVEIRRMMSSFSPRGATSDSISVTKPYLYSRLARASIVFVVVLIGSPCEVPTHVTRVGRPLLVPSRARGMPRPAPQRVGRACGVTHRVYGEDWFRAGARARRGPREGEPRGRRCARAGG